MNDMRKLMEMVDEGVFAPKAKGTFPQAKRKRTQNYSVLAQQYKIEITLVGNGTHWGVAWVDPETGKEGYEERGVNQIVSLDQLVDFAVEEANWAG